MVVVCGVPALNRGMGQRREITNARTMYSNNPKVDLGFKRLVKRQGTPLKCNLRKYSLSLRILKDVSRPEGDLSKDTYHKKGCWQQINTKIDIIEGNLISKQRTKGQACYCYWVNAIIFPYLQ